jgi:hypothetical protein
VAESRAWRWPTYWCMLTSVRLRPLNVPRIEDAVIDANVLLFDWALSLVTGLLFGLLPAWRVSRSTPALALRDGSQTAAGGHTQNSVESGWWSRRQLLGSCCG